MSQVCENEIEDQQEGVEEEFELLCDQAEAEGLKEKRKQEIQKMNKQLDKKIASIQAQKQKSKEEQIIQEIQECKEQFSGLLLRKGSRIQKDDDVTFLVNGRKFISIEDIEQIFENSEALSTLKYFTVGVLVDSTRPIASKNGKTFMILKLTDLVKYDMHKVKKQLALKYKNNSEFLKMAEKNISTNGYKTIKVMVFNELAQMMTTLKLGTIIGLINLKVMPANKDHGFSFKLDYEKQLFKIGYSEDYNICKGSKTQVSTTGGFSIDQKQCTQFVNKSVESLCESHKFIAQTNQLKQIKSTRMGLQSDYVDINRLRKLNQIEAQNKIGAFARGGKSKQPLLSPKTKERLQKEKEKEIENFNNFVKEREQRGQKQQQKHSIFAKITCNERKHLSFQSVNAFPQKDNSKSNKEEEKDDDELEFIGNQKEEGKSIRSFLLNQKMTFEQRFPQNEIEEKANDSLKRKKLE